MRTIRAAVARAFGTPLEIEEVTLDAPEGRSVEVALDACAICHSDISYIDGIWGGALPAVYGHEAAGVVAAVGDRVDGVAPGDRVVVTLIRACGTCAACASGRPVACSRSGGPKPLRTADGGYLHQAMSTGGFAERVVVDVSQIAPIPDAIASDVACLLSCGVITGVGAVVNAARLRPGEDAVVIGAGGVGLNTVQGARLAGARRITAIDMTGEKLAVAREFGATDGILAIDPDPAARLVEATGRLADAVFVTVGALAAYEGAPALLAPGGRVVMVGMPANDARATYVPVDMAAAGQAMIGSKMGDAVLARDIPWLADLYLQGRLRLDELVSERWPLERINEAIADTRTGAARRNVIVFR